ncbi:uncharacterized protein LOC129283139 [Lytechinus pictus]|uniref:uncharacterized protein LOC129283139 n=1 Tax=Lytechinus pictus TaxID=7653 RepID=UPI0030B9F7E2
MLQRLYGIDLGDLTRTLCPNAYRFFEPPLKELLDEFLTELFTVELSAPKGLRILNELDSVCKDRQRFYKTRDMPNGSRFPEILRDLCSDFAGYESFDSFCEDITLIASQDDTDRRKSSKKIVLTVRERVLGVLGIEVDSTMSTKLKEEL